MMKKINEVIFRGIRNILLASLSDGKFSVSIVFWISLQEAKRSSQFKEQVGLLGKECFSTCLVVETLPYQMLGFCAESSLKQPRNLLAPFIVEPF